MTSAEPGFPPRLSDAERDRALEVLREGAAQGRLSQDTFVRRVDVVLRAQWQSELQAVLQDLPLRRQSRGWLAEVVGRVSAWPKTVRRAWQTERLPELLLPRPGRQPFTIGRAPGSMLRLTHYTVSRSHAQLYGSTAGGWRLRDLGSSNGTWVNGSRITGSVSVRPGDDVRFGHMAFRLSAPADLHQPHPQSGREPHHPQQGSISAPSPSPSAEPPRSPQPQYPAHQSQQSGPSGHVPSSAPQLPPAPPRPGPAAVPPPPPHPPRPPAS